MTPASKAFTPRYAEAVAYATAAHGEQVRKGTSIPYIHHPMAVSALVIEHGGDEDQAITGLLHDVLEDCGAEHARQIESGFGPRVLSMVEGLTDGLAGPDGHKQPWRERKERYLAHLKEAPNEVVLVSAADKLHNAMAIGDDFFDIGDEVFERFKPTKADTVWYYESLAKVLGERLGEDHRLVRRLRGAIAGWAGQA